MSEFGNELAEQEPVFSFENARQFISWMFKKTPPDYIKQIPESYLPGMFEILMQNATERLQEMKDLRSKRRLQAPLDLMKRWLEGQSYYRIYEETGKSEGTVRIALVTYAAKLGEIENLDDLISASEAKLAAAKDAAGGQSQPIIEEEALVIPEPEPQVEIVEADSHQPPPKSSELYTPSELVGFLLNVVKKMRPLEEYRGSFTDSLIKDYPMFARLSPEAVEQMRRQAGII